MLTARQNEATAKANAKKDKRASQFRIVPKRNSMLLPEAGHEKGWIKKQAERDEAASTGEGWKSQASVVPLFTSPFPLY